MKKIISISIILVSIVGLTAFLLWTTGNYRWFITDNGKRWQDNLEEKLLFMKPTRIKKTTLPASTPKPPSIIYGKPVQLVIEKLSIDTEVEEVGVVPETNQMDVPKDANKAGWYNKRPYPGEDGSSVITAHYDSTTGAPGIFYNLKKLEAGDNLYLINENGFRIDYVVREVKSVPVSTFPKDLIYSDKGYSQLSLITCAGIWNPLTRDYSNRLVVVATLKKVSSFAELIVTNKTSEIQFMQPSWLDVRTGDGIDGISTSVIDNREVLYFLEANKIKVSAVDIYIRTDFSLINDNMAVSDLFHSSLIEKVDNFVTKIHLFQPQGIGAV